METESQEIGSGDVESLDSATGEGAAYNAGVVTESNVTRLERELSEARAADEARAPQAKIDAAELAVKTAENHLEWAKDALQVAKREVAAEAEAKAAAEAAAAEATDEPSATETEGN